MNKIENITSYEKVNEVHIWTFDTTNSILFGENRNEHLEAEIANWSEHKKFVDKFGFMFLYPEDYIPIYILMSLLTQNRIIYHPSHQQEDSAITKLNIPYLETRWLYSEEIQYDKNYITQIVQQKFSAQVFEANNDNRRLPKVICDLIMNRHAKSRMYELLNSHHIHQSVINGGNSDVYQCTNYIGIQTEIELNNIKKLLSSTKKPSMNQILDSSTFFILNFKGEDLGYARQMKILSKTNMHSTIKKICSQFDGFKQRLEKLNSTCTNLEDYQLKLRMLEMKYGY